MVEKHINIFAAMLIMGMAAIDLALLVSSIGSEIRVALLCGGIVMVLAAGIPAIIAVLRLVVSAFRSR